MSNQVIILHGWSDTSKSFEPLAKRLESSGWKVLGIWLGDYASKDDDVSIPDVAKRMEEVLHEHIAQGKITPPFDMVVHSTGGLVARQWLAMFDAQRKQRQLQRLVMLAPANHGSKLAALGKSMIGRLTVGLDNGFQTGKQMLDSLELGSPYQWQLALQDVFAAYESTPVAPIAPAYSTEGCMPFVITGIQGYRQLLRRTLNEDGADGTVRASAANLSAYGMTLDFSHSETDPIIQPWKRSGPFESFAFKIVDNEDHGSIVSGETVATFNLIREALETEATDAAYQAVRDRWYGENDLLSAASGQSNPQQYFQLNTFVVDDQGAPIPDHFIEFAGESKADRDRALDVFQRKVLQHAYNNQTNGACKCFYLDRTALMTSFYKNPEAGSPEALMVSISAAPLGKNVRYLNSTEVGAVAQARLHLAAEAMASDRWLKRHSTHYLKIIIPRRPNNEVFKLRRL